VRHHVVQLAGDADAFLPDLLAGAFGLGGLLLAGLFGQSGPVAAAGRGGVADEPAGGQRQEALDGFGGGRGCRGRCGPRR
jgi:hypothetical protein